MKEKNAGIIRAYFKNGCLSKKDILLAALNKKIPYSIHAKKISSFFNSQNNKPSASSGKVTIHLQPYTGNNAYAKHMISFLEKNLKDDLVGAYAHGSVGTCEEIAYSDFDAFVIIKNNSLQHPGKLKKIALVLNQSEKIMTAMDPLQHHGWFVLTEDDLYNYPEDYLPHELWQYATVLTGEKELVVHVDKTGYHDEFIGAYHKFSGHLLRNLRSRKFLVNYYDLKSVLSGFMLLPSVYLQAKNGKAIFKKFSFDNLKKEMGAAYEVMDEVSAIRAQWNYRPSTLYKFLLQQKPFLLTYFFKKKLSGKLSTELQHKIDDAFIKRMITFVEVLNKNIAR